MFPPPRRAFLFRIDPRVQRWNERFDSCMSLLACDFAARNGWRSAPPRVSLGVCVATVQQGKWGVSDPLALPPIVVPRPSMRGRSRPTCMSLSSGRTRSVVDVADSAACGRERDGPVDSGFGIASERFRRKTAFLSIERAVALDIIAATSLSVASCLSSNPARLGRPLGRRAARFDRARCGHHDVDCAAVLSPVKPLRFATSSTRLRA